MGCGAEGAQQLRNKFGQNLARPLAAGRPQPAVMPAAHQCGNRGRLDKAKPRKSAQRFRIILDPGEDEVAGAGKARSLLEELGIVPLDRDEMAKQIGVKRIRLRLAEKDPDSCDPRAVRRKHMRLRVLDHLQAVLETAQEAIIVDQLGSR